MVTLRPVRAKRRPPSFFVGEAWPRVHCVIWPGWPARTGSTAFVITPLCAPRPRRWWAGLGDRMRRSSQTAARTVSAENTTVTAPVHRPKTRARVLLSHPVVHGLRCRPVERIRPFLDRSDSRFHWHLSDAANHRGPRGGAARVARPLRGVDYNDLLVGRISASA